MLGLDFLNTQSKIKGFEFTWWYNVWGEGEFMCPRKSLFIAQLGTNGISIYTKLSMPSKCVIFNIEYLHQYFR